MIKLIFVSKRRSFVVEGDNRGKIKYYENFALGNSESTLSLSTGFTGIISNRGYYLKEIDQSGVFTVIKDKRCKIFTIVVVLQNNFIQTLHTLVHELRHIPLFLMGNNLEAHWVYDRWTCPYHHNWLSKIITKILRV